MPTSLQVKRIKSLYHCSSRLALVNVIERNHETHICFVPVRESAVPTEHAVPRAAGVSAGCTVAEAAAAAHRRPHSSVRVEVADITAAHQGRRRLHGVHQVLDHASASSVAGEAEGAVTATVVAESASALAMLAGGAATILFVFDEFLLFFLHLVILGIFGKNEELFRFVDTFLQPDRRPMRLVLGWREGVNSFWSILTTFPHTQRWQSCQAQVIYL